MTPSVKYAPAVDDELERISAYFRGRVVLVTGGFGFVGSALARCVVAAGGTLRILQRTRYPETPGTQGSVFRGDLLDPDIWDRVLPGVDTVFHLAAQTSARISEEDPLLDYRTNAEATWRLLDGCRRLGSKPDVVFAGTETQCGRPGSLPLNGGEPDRPLSFYDLHKLMAEEALEFHARRGSVQGTTLRLPTVYGEAHATREGSRDNGVINRMIRTAAGGGTLTIYGTGDRLRDYVHVDDVARAFALAACSLEHCNGKHFLVGTGKPHTVADAVSLIVCEVERQAGVAVPVVHVDPPSDEPEIARYGYTIDPAPFHAATRWQPRWTLENGIEYTVRAVLNSLAAAT